MKLKILLIFFTICRTSDGQDPVADFRCTFYSFDSTTNECCIAFEDFASDSDGSVIFQSWDFGDTASGSLNTSTGHFLHHCYASPGSYTVTFSVIDNDNNVDTLRAINSIVVDSTGCSCNWLTGISDISGTALPFQIYRNPSAGTFTLRISSHEKILVEIINPFGETVYVENFSGSNEYIINSNLSKGVYLVRVNYFAGKLIIN